MQNFLREVHVREETADFTASTSVAAAKPAVGRTRWVILGLLFFATTINYIDRQVIGILKPTLSQDLGWNDVDYANIVFFFQLAYALGYIGVGRIIDLLGVKRGYGLAVLIWSAAAMAHGLARSTFGFGVARFALGIGEGGNFPACIKAVRTWFPASERALASGIFNAGTNVGALITPIAVPWLALSFGWPMAFYVTGALGLTWLVAWWALYDAPEEHPGLSSAERAHIQRDPEPPTARIPYRQLLTYRETWAYAAVQFLTSPVWWFYLFWLPDFLHRTHGLELTTLGPPLIVIYLLTDVGSIAGGWLSSTLVKRGMGVLTARKVAMLICALCVLPIVFAAQAEGLWTATLLVALAASAHQGWAANMFTLPSDTMPQSAVSSMAGFGGMVGAVGGMGIAKLAGYVLQTTGSFVTLFWMVPAAYFLALLLLHLLLPRTPRIAPGTA
jgi:ACS family hexuronate transporter-like MFS transporter